MIRTFMIAAASVSVLMLSPTAFAQQPGQYGNADEAKAMLVKAVAAVKADKTKALDMFAKGEGGFLDRDLYPFCFNISDGKLHPLANPNVKQNVGQDVRRPAKITASTFHPKIASDRVAGTQERFSYSSGSP